MKHSICQISGCKSKKKELKGTENVFWLPKYPRLIANLGRWVQRRCQNCSRFCACAVKCSQTLTKTIYVADNDYDNRFWAGSRNNGVLRMHRKMANNIYRPKCCLIVNIFDSFRKSIVEILDFYRKSGSMNPLALSELWPEAAKRCFCACAVKCRRRSTKTLWVRQYFNTFIGNKYRWKRWWQKISNRNCQ